MGTPSLSSMKTRADLNHGDALTRTQVHTATAQRPYLCPPLIRHPLALAFIAALPLTFIVDHASATPQEHNKLQHIQGEIKGLHGHIEQTQRKKKHEEKSLRDIERSISATLKALREQDNTLAELNNTLSALAKQKKTASQQLEKQKKRLKALIVQQYALGNKHALKLLLNQKDPQSFSRALTYNRYLNEAHATLINTFKKNIQTLEETQRLISKQQEKVLNLKEQHTLQKQQLEKQRKQRRKILSQLSHNIKTKKQKLALLQENEKRLKQTLKRLRESVPRTPSNKHNFAKLKRTLPWPTQGKVIHKFGSKKGTGALKWQGLFIKTSPDQDVKSVAAGKVIFSDWLQGFGMLIIIDHGDKYISLYGQNQTLFKDVGDWVERQEIIASVSDEKNSGLYFELRHNGKPINPLAWLKK